MALKPNVDLTVDMDFRDINLDHWHHTHQLHHIPLEFEKPSRIKLQIEHSSLDELDELGDDDLYHIEYDRLDWYPLNTFQFINDDGYDIMYSPNVGVFWNEYPVIQLEKSSRKLRHTKDLLNTELIGSIKRTDIHQVPRELDNSHNHFYRMDENDALAELEDDEDLIIKMPASKELFTEDEYEDFRMSIVQRSLKGKGWWGDI